MHSLRLPGCFLLLMLTVSCLSDQTPVATTEKIGENENMASHREEHIQITGIPTFFGNEPRAYLCLVVKNTRNGQDLVYYIHHDYQEALRPYTGTRITVTGYFDPFHPASFDARGHINTLIPESWSAASGH